jgi:hypothetical protein
MAPSGRGVTHGLIEDYLEIFDDVALALAVQRSAAIVGSRKLDPT